MRRRQVAGRKFDDDDDEAISSLMNAPVGMGYTLPCMGNLECV